MAKEDNTIKEVCSEHCNNPAEEEHACPYKDEYGDSETLCRCCNECTYQCAMDI